MGQDSSGTLPQASSASLPARLMGRLATASHAALRSERQVELHAVLSWMDPSEREILALRRYEGLPNAKSAEVLGLSKTAAHNRFVRALGRLLELLEHVPGCFERG
jgi:RNA polymerase sigma-70 factor (ECF subfamily)